MKPCFGYTRVSTLRQGDGASLEAQKDAITGFASQNNLEIVQWFEEKETASRIGRPVFGEMLGALRDGKAEGLVMHKIDRSARNFSDWARLDDVARLGIKVYFAADSLDFDSRGGRLLADIQMALAADYSRNLSLEVKKGIYGRVRHGIYPFRAPIGYLDTGGGNPKSIDPVKGPLVKKLFELYASGEYSITSLTEEMRRRGLTGYGARPAVRRNIETILRNPFYCGKMRIAGKLYPGIHEPLISAARFRRVQAIKKSRHVKKSTRHRLLFRGLFHCAACHGLLSGERQKAHIYYRCHSRGCAAKTIREDRLEHSLIAILRRIQIAQDDQEKIADGIRRWFDNNGTDEIEKSLRLRIADARARHDRLTDLLVDGAIEQEAFQSRKESNEFELQHLREELAALESQSAKRQDYDRLLEMAMDLVALYESGSRLQKRRLIKNCLEDRWIDNGVVTAHAAKWLIELPRFGDGGERELDYRVFNLAVREAEQSESV
ncbi:recombinase family protein [Roseovarius nitratireducens]|uniref:recombinase family protein n=1 Tax=Roseovarius nitratireducens TaxID=2044597 RepID=UPI000CE28CC1|nr:recombinase family protein [Roseovarius nitratireducens]